jgi:hypothetical protein
LAKDDFEVVAYKVLAYAYACLKAGVEASTAKALEIAGINEVYFLAVLKSLASKGLIEGVPMFKHMNGDVVDYGESITITMDGAVYLRENGRMAKVGKYLGSAFEKVLEIAVKSTMVL